MRKIPLMWASGLTVVLILVGLAPIVGVIKAAIPVPDNMWGHPYDETYVQLNVAEPITSWIDGVEYGRNLTFVSGLEIWFNIFTEGNWVTSPTEPNTPWIKEGGDLDEPIMYVWGDMTNIDPDPEDDGVLNTGVFIESHLWWPGNQTRGDINLSSVQPPLFPKISWIIPEPSDGYPDYVLIYTEDPFFDMSGFYLEKNDGSLNGPSQMLSGVSNETAYFYANLTDIDLDGCGDELKLVWSNTGPAFGGRDIVVDRVEWNASLGGYHGPEPDNTIMTDAIAPSCTSTDFALHREGIWPVFARDTNDNEADFLTDLWPWPRPTPIQPFIQIIVPAGGEHWKGGTVQTISWIAYDDVFPNDLVSFWVNYSLLDGVPGTWVEAGLVGIPSPHPFLGWGDVTHPMSVSWSVPEANTMIASIEVCMEGSEVLCVVSLLFEIDSLIPFALSKLNGLDHVIFHTDESPELYLWADISDNNGLAGANYTIGQNNWQSSTPLDAYDGTHDEANELVRVYVLTPPPPFPAVGVYEYCVYVWDDAGNWNEGGSCTILEMTDDISAKDATSPEPPDLDYISAQPDHNYISYALSASSDAWLYRLESSNQYLGPYQLLDQWETPAGSPEYHHYGAGSDNPDDFYYRFWIADHHMNWASGDVIAKINIRLEGGLQLLSIPTISDWSGYSNLDQIRDSYDRVYSYDPSDEVSPWDIISAAKPYQWFEDLELGKGYWINMEQSDTIIALGEIPSSVTYNLVAGWNLVGYCSPYARTVGEALSGISSYMVEGYSNVGPYHLQRLTDSSLMEPFQAYWIWVPSDTTWVLTN